MGLMSKVKGAFGPDPTDEELDARIAFQLKCLPEYYLPGIGIGDFIQEGESLVELLRSLGGLRPDDRVLDLGCGLGRVAMPLQRLLRRGSYDGLDVVEGIIHWNSVNYTRVTPNFRFKQLDVRSSTYNPEGALESADVVFPYDDASFTFALATSLFSHLLESATLRYLQELGRVLRPGSRALLTFFLLDEKAQALAERGETDLDFPHVWEHGRLNNLDQPEDAVAYDSEWLVSQLPSAGFRLLSIEWGRWSGNRRGPSYQDAVLLERV